MPYYQNNEIFVSEENTKKEVFTVTNTTAFKWFCNKFELLPSAAFAKHGKIFVEKNGRLEYTNDFKNRDKNDLYQYSVYSIRSLIQSLDRYDTLKISFQSRNDQKITLGISIELDFEDAPLSATITTRNKEELYLTSEFLSLAESDHFDQTFEESHYLPLDFIGYTKMQLSIVANEDYNPTIESNTANIFQSVFIDKLINARRRTTTLPTKRQTSTRTYFDYDRMAAFRYLDSQGNEFDPILPAGVFETNTLIINLGDQGEEPTRTNINLESVDDFNLDINFMYVRYFAYSTSSGGSITTTINGERIYIQKTQQLKIFALTELNEENPELLMLIEAYTGAVRSIQVNTAKPFIKISKIVSYEFRTSSRTNDQYYRVNGNSTFITTGALTPTQKTQGRATIDALTPVLHQGNGIPYITQSFPDFFMPFLNSSNFNAVNKRPTTNEITVNYMSKQQPNTQVTIALEAKGVNDEWFTVIENIGDIANLGKTLINISEFDFVNTVVFPKGEKVLRLKVTATNRITLSIGATLSN